MTNNWVLRGLVFAAGMLVVRLIQGALINLWQTQATLISVALLLVFIAGVAIWALYDGRDDATTQRDPDRRADLAMTWLLAGLLAGVLSGAAAWLIAMVDKALYAGGLINELTTFASFTALLVFIPAVTAVAVGRWQIDRNPPPPVQPGDDDERADTDVFAAVGADVQAATAALSDEPTGAIPVSEEQTSAVAVSEAPTTLIPTQHKKRRWWQRSAKEQVPPIFPAPIAYSAEAESPFDTAEAAPSEQVTAPEQAGDTDQFTQPEQAADTESGADPEDKQP